MWRRARTAKSCGPDAPTLASSSRKEIFADDGGKKARSPGRARRKPLKPLRGECRAISGVTVVTTLVCYLYTAHEAAGASNARHSLRPLMAEGGRFQQNSDVSSREIAKLCLVVIACDKRQAFARGSKATKQSTLVFAASGLLRGACHRARVRATRWLAMTCCLGPAV